MHTFIIQQSYVAPQVVYVAQRHPRLVAPEILESNHNQRNSYTALNYNMQHTQSDRSTLLGQDSGTHWH